MMEIDERRRRLLVALLAAGVFADPRLVHAAVGRVPRPLPAGQSIYRLRGRVWVDGARATDNTLVGPNAEIETEGDGEVVFAVGSDAFLMRRGSRMTLGAARDRRDAVESLRVSRGGVLTVFGRRRHRLRTPLAQVSIRGTGVYVQVEEQRDYVCTCYGETEVASLDDPASSRSVVSKHHDSPLFVEASGESGRRVLDAPFRDHTDEELIILEALVGRRPPFQVTQGGYGMPRRETY